jgi:hypothetical protein
VRAYVITTSRIDVFVHLKLLAARYSCPFDSIAADIVTRAKASALAVQHASTMANPNPPTYAGVPLIMFLVMRYVLRDVLDLLLPCTGRRYIYIYIYVYRYMFTYKFMHMYMYMYVCMHVCLYECMCTCVCVCVCARARACVSGTTMSISW